MWEQENHARQNGFCGEEIQEAAMLLSAEHLNINFGSRQLLKDVSLYLNSGDKVGIIGINGTGKSTLLKVLSGAQEPDGGTVSRDPNVQISYLPQNPVMRDENTILEQVFASFPAEFRTLNEYEAKAMLGKLGIADSGQKIGTLSGGQRKRVALAAALIHPADVLILDEPTNHLDSEAVLWLEDRLMRFRGGLLMVTHDRYFLERVVNHITELSRGKLNHYEANYSRYLELKTEQEEMAEASERKRQSILRVEREWIMRGCRARTTKSKDRVQRYETMKAQSAPETDEAVALSAASSRLGKKTIELQDVSKAFDGKTVLSHFSYSILRNDRVGIVGHNGVGKSTLLHLIAGELAPDSGTVDMGGTVKIGHFSQEGRELDLNQRVYDFIHDIADEVKTDAGTFTANQMMERFLFPGDLQSQPIGRLSGGERRRLYLLSILMTAPNILLLDEPTNDLDVTTLSILEDYLQSFPGPILAVSHDRFFLDKLADSIFEIRDGGQVLRYTGNWSDWAEKRREEERPAAQERETRQDTAKPREKKLKFTYKEQLEYQHIDEELAAAEQRVNDCKAEMGNCGSDYIKLQALQEQLDALQTALDEKTERWCYLNELQEKIDAQE
jgi:ATP-binding cassette subfamily F protein uup